jgi:hypothetical protein
LPLHGTGGIDENSVEIEEDGGAPEDGHRFFSIENAAAPKRDAALS